MFKPNLKISSPVLSFFPIPDYCSHSAHLYITEEAEYWQGAKLWCQTETEWVPRHGSDGSTFSGCQIAGVLSPTTVSALTIVSAVTFVTYRHISSQCLDSNSGR
jgi:hypothetical protein